MANNATLVDALQNIFNRCWTARTVIDSSRQLQIIQTLMEKEKIPRATIAPEERWKKLIEANDQVLRREIEQAFDSTNMIPDVIVDAVSNMENNIEDTPSELMEVVAA